MHEHYENRALRIERGAWPRVAASLQGAAGDAVRDAGGVVFGLWTGEIGFASDEGAVMTAWQSGAIASSALDKLDGVVESTTERVAATVRPTSTDGPTEPGIYAHRWFETAESDWPEFLELSDTAWPSFEGAHPGIHIIGFWKSLDTAAPGAKVLLMTRYTSLAQWEQSRPYAPSPTVGAEEARTRFLRRAQLTTRTVVRVTRLYGAR